MQMSALAVYFRARRESARDNDRQAAAAAAGINLLALDGERAHIGAGEEGGGEAICGMAPRSSVHQVSHARADHQQHHTAPRV